MKHVKVTLDKKEYTLVYNFDAIAEAEDLLDRPLITGLRRRDIAHPTVSLVRAMFYACAHTHHSDLTFEHAKQLITPQNLAEVWGKVLDAWMAAQPDEDNDDPQKGQS